MAVLEVKVLHDIFGRLLSVKVWTESFAVFWVTVSTEIDVSFGASLVSSGRTAVSLEVGLRKLKRW